MKQNQVGHERQCPCERDGFVCLFDWLVSYRPRQLLSYMREMVFTPCTDTCKL